MLVGRVSDAFASCIGPITVLNKTIYDVVANKPGGPNYLQFIGWVYLWGAILHWITAALNCKNILFSHKAILTIRYYDRV